jgi:hypothetical protein
MTGNPSDFRDSFGTLLIDLFVRIHHFIIQQRLLLLLRGSLGNFAFLLLALFNDGAARIFSEFLNMALPLLFLSLMVGIINEVFFENV